MKINVAVHGRFHGFDLAAQLHSRDSLGCVFTTYPAFAARRFLPPPIPVKSAPVLEAWRRLGPRFGLGRALPAGLPRRFAQFVARTLPDAKADILVGWSSATLEAIPVARGLGMKIVIERGSTHIVHQTALLEEAYRRIGGTFFATPAEIVDRELQEYEQADAIAVPSALAAESFVDHGIPADKMIVSRLGVDLDGFSPPADPRPGDRKPRILCVGAVGVRKGADTLIQAVGRLGDDAELHLVGPVEDGFRPVLNRLPTGNIVFHGPVSHRQLVDRYRDADIFCLPSVEEGFGMVVLEAMACGLPVVISDRVGAADAVPKDAGIVVPASDENALSDALRRFVDDRTFRAEAGGRARSAALTGGNRWDDCADRLMPAYRKLIA